MRDSYSEDQSSYSYLPWAFYDAWYVACSVVLVATLALRGVGALSERG